MLFILKLEHKDGRTTYPISFIVFMPENVPAHLKVIHARPLSHLTNPYIPLHSSHPKHPSHTLTHPSHTFTPSHTLTHPHTPHVSHPPTYTRTHPCVPSPCAPLRPSQMMYTRPIPLMVDTFKVNKHYTLEDPEVHICIYAWACACACACACMHACMHTRARDIIEQPNVGAWAGHGACS